MLRIEIDTWHFSKIPDIKLKISVTHKGETISYEKIILYDMFSSTWERMMDEAKEIIRVNVSRISKEGK